MKQQTKAELQEECARLREQNTLLSHALTILTQKSTPNAREVVREKDGCRHVYEVHGATQPHGGILIVTFRYPNQRPSVSAYYLDRYRPGGHLVWLESELPHRIAVERLRAKAHSLQHATL